MNAKRAVIILIQPMSSIGCHSSIEPESESSLSAIDEKGGVWESSTGSSFLESNELDAQKALARESDIEVAMRVAIHYSLGKEKPGAAYPRFALAAEVV